MAIEGFSPSPPPPPYYQLLERGSARLGRVKKNLYYRFCLLVLPTSHIRQQYVHQILLGFDPPG